MRSRLAWVLGGLGVAAAFALRSLRRRPQPSVEAPAAPPEDPRAEELRRRLAESRAIVDEREQFEDGETPVDLAEPEAGDPNERRRRVHEQGQTAIERMRGPSESA
jgi:hypothetical protein